MSASASMLVPSPMLRGGFWGGLRLHLNALLWMAVGSLSIFLSLLFINQSAVPDKPEKQTYSTSFEVKQIAKPKPKKVVKKRRPRKSRAPVNPAPMVNLDTALSGIDFGLPAFSLDDMGEVDESLLGDTRNVVMTSDMVDVAPRARKRAPLDYPPRAKHKEIEGYVVLSLLIGTDGRVQKAKVIESSPPEVFDDAALRSVRSWVFEPARYKGQAVETWANQTIRFDLG